MPNIQEMLSAAHEIKANFDEIILRANVNDSGEARVSASLCLTISEQFAGILHLFGGGFSSHAPTLLRSMLEGYANLLNLVGDSSYLDQIRFEDAKNNIKLFTDYMRDPDMNGDREAIDTLAAWQVRDQPVYDELYARGLREKKVIDKFRMAGIAQDYVAYRVFCSFAHNQLTTLISRHADRFDMRYHTEAPEEMQVSILNVATTILRRSVNTLPVYTDLTPEALSDAIGRVDLLWNAVTSR